MIFQFISLKLFTDGLGVNSIYSSSIGFIITTILMLIWRKDLWKDVLFTALFSGFILVLGEGFLLLFAETYLEKYYLLHGEAPVLLGLFPVTEFIWGLTFGMVIGPMYEVANGLGYEAAAETDT